MAGGIIIDGVNMQTSYGLYVRGASVRAGLPDIRTSTFDLGQQHGARVYGKYFKPRYYNLELAIVNKTQDTLMQAFDAIKTAMDPRNGVKLWIFDEDQDGIGATRDRGVYAMVHGPFNEVRLSTGNTFQANLIVPSGVTVATSATVQTLTISTTPETFYAPAASGSTVNGNMEARPVWVIKNTSGSSSACWLKNITRDENMYISTIANGEWIQIDTDKEWVRSSDDSGATWTHCETRLSSLSGLEFPLLTAGVQNEIQTTTLDTGSVVATYRARWL